jgi:hypothetical protein
VPPFSVELSDVPGVVADRPELVDGEAPIVAVLVDGEVLSALPGVDGPLGNVLEAIDVDEPGVVPPRVEEDEPVMVPGPVVPIALDPSVLLELNELLELSEPPTVGQGRLDELVCAIASPLNAASTAAA